MKTTIKNQSKKLLSLCGVALILALSNQAQAGTVGITINPSVTFLGICFMSVSDINFGQIQAGATNISANGTLSVLCTRTTAYTAAIDFAEYPTASRLVGQTKGDIINYGIVNPQNSQYFETSGKYSNPIVDTASGFTKDYTLKATIGSVGYVSPDTYKGTVNVLVTY